MSDTNFDGLKLESRSIMDKDYFFYPVFIFCAVYIALFCWLGFYAWPQIDDWAFFNIFSQKSLASIGGEMNGVCYNK